MPNIEQNIYIHQNFNRNEIREVLLHNATISSRPVPTVGGDYGLLYFDTDIERILVWNGQAWKIVKYLDDRDLVPDDDVRMQKIWLDSYELTTILEGTAQSPNAFVEYKQDIQVDYLAGTLDFYSIDVKDVVIPQTFSDGTTVPSYFEPILKDSLGNVIDRIDTNGREIWNLTEIWKTDYVTEYRVRFSDVPTLLSNQPFFLTFYQYIGRRLTEGSGGGGTASLVIEDYLTGASFSNVNKMIFRGNTVTVPGGSATGVLATDDPTQPNTVVVWIPAPDYVDYFNQDGNVISDVSTASRRIADSLGSYNLGSYGAGTTQPTINYTHLGQLSYTCTEFAVFDNLSSDLILTLYDADGTTIIESLTYSLTGVGMVSNNGLTINVTQLDANQDRYKSTATFTVDLTDANLIPLGGKFTVELEHDNVGDTSYVQSNKTQTAMYDRDTDNGSTSTAQINGTVSMIEQSASLFYMSGVAYYDNGSTFEVEVRDMDDLNEITYPTGNQLNLNFSTNTGIPDANIGAGGSGYVGWTNAYNIDNVGYLANHSISSSNLVTPGVDANNSLNSGSTTDLTANIHDWVNNVDSETSPGYNWLILSKSSISDRNTEDLNTETDRLVVRDALVGVTESSFDSTIDITTAGSYSYELQQIQGSSPNGTSRLVFPKEDFSVWQPLINITNSTDYTSAAGSSITLPVINNRSTLATTGQVLTDYRWYLRKFSTTGLASVQGNGTFEFSTDFVEADLATQNTGIAGSGDLQLFLGLTNNTVPTGWYDMSRLFSVAGGVRANATGGGSSNLDSNGKISWNTEFVNGWTAYLLVGIKDTATSNEISQIDIEDGNWD
ncbi:MAG: hypothetical protein SLAVMIC_00460 [uncultured marine phage]|uniref:Uncharacterized protein n=1 Tax=uncultured marine phage TaxID=707152 RepID=A0A8D9CBK4_9VIRU|nr:MAG: hypothetical protein SLAVMIC_00460 [uncultured marine phage]